MESSLIAFGCRRGFMLPTVLIITAIGLLFGAGSLLLFRFQCQHRIERQHEMEKVYAVRSALNYIKGNTGEIADNGLPLRYHTGSDRDLNLLIRPSEVVFPQKSNPKHLVIESGDSSKNFQLRENVQYSSEPDYEYGGISNGVVLTEISSSQIANNYDNKYGLGFGDVAVTNNVKWWVNIGMQKTGSWLEEAYGRRYYFHPYTYVPGNNFKDTIRLCIIRNVTNENNKVGCRHGWPLSCEGERAIVFQISPTQNNNDKEADMFVTAYEYKNGVINENAKAILDMADYVASQKTDIPTGRPMGIQLAANMISMFYIESGAAKDSDSSLGYVFSEAVQMDSGIYDYFSSPQKIGGKEYPGIYTNAMGKIVSPELRVVFEIETTSDSRPMLKSEDNEDSGKLDFLSYLKVTPAYQYDVFIEHPTMVTNKATVAQKVVDASSTARTKPKVVITYDTHGTENKGFRYDERQSRNGGAR